MYYYIKGELVALDPNAAVIDAGGVAYLMTISGNTLGKLAGKLGTTVRLYTHLNVREDAMELYGFDSPEERAAFRMLLSVSGVGAKSAISILTLMSPERFAAAVMSGDAKAMAKAQGIGAKTAARVILELKDKVSKELGGGDSSSDPGVEIAAGGQSNLSEAVNALMVLGYTRSEAAYALKTVDPNADLESMIRAALNRLLK